MKLERVINPDIKLVLAMIKPQLRTAWKSPDDARMERKTCSKLRVNLARALNGFGEVLGFPAEIERTKPRITNKVQRDSKQRIGLSTTSRAAVTDLTCVALEKLCLWSRVRGPQNRRWVH